MSIRVRVRVCWSVCVTVYLSVSVCPCICLCDAHLMAARRTLSSLQAAHQHLISNISRQDTAAAGQQAAGMRAGLWEPGLVVQEMSWVLRILVIKLCVCILKCVWPGHH